MPKRTRATSRLTRKRRRTGAKPVRRRRVVRRRKKTSLKKKTASRTKSGILLGRKNVSTLHCMEPQMAKGEEIKTPAQFKKFMNTPLKHNRTRSSPYQVPFLSLRHYYGDSTPNMTLTPSLGDKIQELGQFNLTSMVTPIIGGHQHTGRDLAATRYAHYIITSVDWKIKVKNYYIDVDTETTKSGDTYLVMWMSASNTAAPPTEINTVEKIQEGIAMLARNNVSYNNLRIMKLPRPDVISIGNAAGAQRDDEGVLTAKERTMKGTFRIKDWPVEDPGDGGSAIGRLRTFSALSGASPSPQVFLHIAVGNDNNWHTSNDNPINGRFEAVSHCTWYETVQDLGDYAEN